MIPSCILLRTGILSKTLNKNSKKNSGILGALSQAERAPMIRETIYLLTKRLNTGQRPCVARDPCCCGAGAGPCTRLSKLVRWLLPPGPCLGRRPFYFRPTACGHRPEQGPRSEAAANLFPYKSGRVISGPDQRRHRGSPALHSTGLGPEWTSLWRLTKASREKFHNTILVNVLVM